MIKKSYKFICKQGQKKQTMHSAHFIELFRWMNKKTLGIWMLKIIPGFDSIWIYCMKFHYFVKLLNQQFIYTHDMTHFNMIMISSLTPPLFDFIASQSEWNRWTLRLFLFVSFLFLFVNNLPLSKAIMMLRALQPRHYNHRIHEKYKKSNCSVFPPVPHKIINKSMILHEFTWSS